MADDFLFPMSSGISYNSSPESDGEFCEPETPRNMSRQPSEEPSHLSRFNSDPNLANIDESGHEISTNKRPPVKHFDAIFSFSHIRCFSTIFFSVVSHFCLLILDYVFLRYFPNIPSNFNDFSLPFLGNFSTISQH